MVRVQVQRRTYADPCGIARALDVLGERWSLLVVRELLLGPRRFGQVLDGLTGMSPNVLSQRLRELESGGIVRRRVLEPPASVAVYELTERGHALEPLLLDLGRWGSTERQTSRRELSATSMLVALKTMFDPPVDARVTYGLQLADEQFEVTIAGDEIGVARGRPEPADARLATDVSTLRMVVFFGTGVRAAEQAGALTITGDRRAAARFPKFFRRPAVA